MSTNRLFSVINVGDLVSVFKTGCIVPKSMKCYLSLSIQDQKVLDR